MPRPRRRPCVLSAPSPVHRATPVPGHRCRRPPGVARPGCIAAGWDSQASVGEEAGEAQWLDLPHADLAIIAAEGHRPSIRLKATEMPCCGTGYLPDLCAGLTIPQPAGAIPAHRGDESTVRTPAHVGHRSCMSTQGEGPALSIHFPEVDHLLGNRSDDAPSGLN